MHVPWRRVASWHCDACGMCCSVYRPRLTAYEYLKLLNTGFVEEKAGKFYIRKIGSNCPFQHGNLCSLQHSLKPLSCKIFPFAIRKSGENSALFEFEGEEFYVYADTFCPNLIVKRDLKPRKEVYELVKEVVAIVTGRSDLRLLTAQLNRVAATPQQHHHRLVRA